MASSLPGPFTSATLFAFSCCTFATLMHQFYPAGETSGGSDPTPAVPEAPSSDGEGFQLFGLGPLTVVFIIIGVLALSWAAIIFIGLRMKPTHKLEKDEKKEETTEEVKEEELPKKQKSDPTTCCAGGMSKSVKLALSPISSEKHADDLSTLEK